jgi:hypothetical protein
LDDEGLPQVTQEVLSRSRRLHRFEEASKPLPPLARVRRRPFFQEDVFQWHYNTVESTFKVREREREE